MCLWAALPTPVQAQAPDSLSRYQLNLAHSFFVRNNPDSAVYILAALRKRFVNQPKSPVHPAIDKALADYYSAQSADSLALPLYLHIIAEPAAIVNDSMRATVNARLAVIYFNRKSYSRALASDSACVAYFQASGDRLGLAEAYFRISRVRYAQRSYRAAETLVLRSCLPMFSALNNLRGRYACFDLLGGIYLALGRTSEAKWFYIQAQMLAPKLADREPLIRSYIGLGRVKIRLNDLDLAQRDFTIAKNLSGGASANTLAELHGGLAALYKARGQKDKAAAEQGRSRRFQALTVQSARTRAHAAEAVAARYLKAAEIIPQTTPATPVRAKPFPVVWIVIFASCFAAAILFYIFRRKRDSPGS